MFHLLRARRHKSLLEKYPYTHSYAKSNINENIIILFLNGFQIKHFGSSKYRKLILNWMSRCCNGICKCNGFCTLI